MPERVAKTDPFKQITDATGSGPFKFVKDDWVAGARAVWVKNDKYVPRDEPADFFAGGKRVYVDRVEHIVMPDGATAAAALQTGEVDWVHVPQIDLVPMLKKSAGVTVAVYDPLGWLGVIRPNFLYPPFDNRKLLRAILPAIDQREFLAAVIGEQSDLGKLPAGFFTVGSAMANMAGMEALTGPPDVEKAKRLVAESGYKGEPVLLMSPHRPAGARAGRAGHPTRCSRRSALTSTTPRWTGPRWSPAAPRVNRRTRAAGTRSARHGQACRSPIRADISHCAATAPAPGSAGPPTRRWKHCAILVRRARPRRTEEDLRGHADLRLRAGAVHPDRAVVLSDGVPQQRHRYRQVAGILHWNLKKA